MGVSTRLIPNAHTREARRIAALLVERPEIFEVWLFGSVARGVARPNSDIDLCLVTKLPAGTSLPHWKAELRLWLSQETSADPDLVVYSPEKWKELGENPGTLAGHIRDRGLCLARKEHENNGG